MTTLENVTEETMAKLEEENDTVGNLEFPHSAMKLSDTRDSLSSIDSDVSLSFDRRGSDEGIKSGDEIDSKDSKDKETEDEGTHMVDVSDSASDAGSTGGGKDSGCEITIDPQEPPFTPPSNELADKIVAQVEFYFSDVNITKDAFLLKHVKRNKEGYVSLKLISSFKRVKHLTKDWRVVAASLKRSSKLEINDVGTKLRRLEPLPQYDETTPSRTIVAVHLPIEKPTIENVSKLFSKCGEIALIRVLRPGNPVPADVRQFVNKNPSLSGIVCALVEFSESESARNALQMQNDDFPGYGKTLKVYELNSVPNPEKRKKIQITKKPFINRMTNEMEYSPCCSSSEAEMEYWVRSDHRNKYFRRGSSGFPHRVCEGAWVPRRMSACSHSSDSSSSGYYYSPRRLSNSSRDSGAGSDIYLSRRISNCSLSGSEYDGMRRFSNCSQMSGFSSPARSRSNSNGLFGGGGGDHLVRTPVGPDGTRGFHAMRQRRVSDLALYSR